MSQLFNPGDLQRWQELEQQIAEHRSRQVTENHHAAQAQLAKAQAQLQQAEHKLSSAKAAEAAASTQVEKLSQPSCCSRLCSSEKKLEAAAAAATAAQASTAAARADLASAHAAASPVVELATAWAGKYGELQAAERSQAALADAMFSQPHWQAEVPVATATAAAADLNRKAAEAEGHASTYARAQQLLQSADSKLASAQQAMSRAQAVGRVQAVGTVMGGPGRRRVRQPMSSAVNMGNVRRADDATRSAAADVAAARAALPSLPWTAEASLRSASRGIFMHLLVGGVISNLMQNAAFRRSMSELNEMRANVQACLQWVQANSSAFQGSSASLRAQAAAKQAEARAYQQAKLREALTAAAGGAAQPVHSVAAS